MRFCNRPRAATRRAPAPRRGFRGGALVVGRRGAAGSLRGRGVGSVEARRRFARALDDFASGGRLAPDAVLRRRRARRVSVWHATDLDSAYLRQVLGDVAFAGFFSGWRSLPSRDRPFHRTSGVLVGFCERTGPEGEGSPDVRVVAVPVLQDNYSYLIVDEDERVAAVVDCAEVEPVLGRRAQRRHRDGAVDAPSLRSRRRQRGARGQGSGPRLRQRRRRRAIQKLTDGVREGDTVRVGRLRPGAVHPRAHQPRRLSPRARPCSPATLFAAGCGRPVQGTIRRADGEVARQAERALPGTRVYCGHGVHGENLWVRAHARPSSAAIADKLAWAEEHAVRRDRRRSRAPSAQTCDWPLRTSRSRTRLRSSTNPVGRRRRRTDLRRHARAEGRLLSASPHTGGREHPAARPSSGLHGGIEPRSIYDALATSPGHPDAPPTLYTGLPVRRLRLSRLVLAERRRRWPRPRLPVVTWQVGPAVRHLARRADRRAAGPVPRHPARLRTGRPARGRHRGDPVPPPRDGEPGRVVLDLPSMVAARHRSSSRRSIRTCGTAGATERR